MSWIYEKTLDNTSRFVLGTQGIKPLVCFGINPSTATPECLDNTLKSVERIALHNNFDSWIILNVYPQRATNPDDLHSEMNHELHELNIMHIKKVLEEYRPTIWAAWGTIIKKRDYLNECLADIVEITRIYDCRWISFGKVSKDGHPHHPLYLNTQATYNEFLVDDYLKRVG
jgi:hypothetical protein